MTLYAVFKDGIQITNPEDWGGAVWGLSEYSGAIANGENYEIKPSDTQIDAPPKVKQYLEDLPSEMKERA